MVSKGKIKIVFYIIILVLFFKQLHESKLHARARHCCSLKHVVCFEKRIQLLTLPWNSVGSSKAPTIVVSGMCVTFTGELASNYVSTI